MTVQIRDLDADIMDYFVSDLRAKFPKAEFSFAHRSEPCICDGQVQTLINEACRQLNLKYKVMPSHASHDAQNFGEICPVGMIFVPSVDGISHSKDEHTEPEDLENGCEVLCRTVRNFSM